MTDEGQTQSDRGENPADYGKLIETAGKIR